MTTKDQLPPLAEIDPVFHHPDHHAKWSRSEIKWIQQYATDYALAALAQQAQEPVEHPPRVTPEMWMELGKAQALTERSRRTTPQPQPAPTCGQDCHCLAQCGDFYAHSGEAQPEPQVPAPVDEREAAKVSLCVLCAVLDANDWHPNMRKDIQFAIDANRAALQSTAPQATKGGTV